MHLINSSSTQLALGLHKRIVKQQALVVALVRVITLSIVIRQSSARVWVFLIAPRKGDVCHKRHSFLFCDQYIGSVEITRNVITLSATMTIADFCV
jgi:hypothetical protein